MAAQKSTAGLHIELPGPGDLSIGAASPFLSTVAPSRHERILAFGIVMLSMLAFVVTAPFSRVSLTPIPAFLPIYQSAVVIGDIITSVLLLGQYDILRARGLLFIACGYLFNAAMAVFHALSFPGLFAPSGLLGSGPQTTAWLYFFWHGAFPLFVIAYVLSKGKERQRIDRGIPLQQVVLIASLAVVAMASALMLLSTSGAWLLPDIMVGDLDAGTKIMVAVVVSALSIAALALLWRAAPHTLLDMWLMVIMCIWIFDIALSAVLNHGRYDVGWYMGRVYGLLAASFVLIALLLENGRLYARLAYASKRERAYLLHLNDPVITIDVRGIICRANPALERVLGYAIEEVLGQNISILMPESQRSEHDGYIRRYLLTGEARVIGKAREVVGLHKSGELVPLELSISEIAIDGETQFIGTLHDLRDRNLHIAELTRARAAAEQANGAKSAFLATMSHEIRTPLTGMLGMLELLSMTSLDESQGKTLNTAWSSARSLLRIVNDILDWSKIEEGKLELAPHPTSIAQLLQEVVNTYARVASAKCLVLQCSVDPQLSAAHMTDPLRLSQILNNFVSNAIKFTASGSVDIRAEMISRGIGRERIVFSVRDTGCGIAKKDQEHLFQRYRQADADTARMYGGTGLGLSICLRLTQMMGGEVVLQSEPGKGSSFSIVLELPVAEEPERDFNAAHPELEQRLVRPLYESGGDSPWILVVDDHPINRDLLSSQLKILGLRSETAADGREALTKWRSGMYVIVISDCHMPEMDGYDLAREIRRLEAAESLGHTPVIAWSANALPEERARCREAGMDELLVKPARLEQLRAVLENFLPSAMDNSMRLQTGQQAAVQSLSPPRTLDLEILRQVIPDESGQASVLRDFQSHIRADLVILLDALKSGELPQVESTAHRMKGASRMVGAVRMATACAVLEQAARDKDLTALDRTSAELAEAAMAFAAHIDEMGI